MRLDQLTSLCKGDTIINCFSEPLVFLKAEGANAVVVNTSLETEIYACRNVYLQDMYEESDEEISWIKWATKNAKDVKNNLDLDIAKFIYIQAFANGFMHKLRITAEEQLQK